MLRNVQRSQYWPRHAIGAGVAASIVFGVRASSMRSDADLAAITAHSAIVVALAYPILTVFAETALKKLPERLPIIARLALGALLASPALGLLCPTIMWMLNVLPAHIDAGEDRAWLFHFLRTQYLSSCSGYVTAVAPLWVLINVRWYESHAGDQLSRTPQGGHSTETASTQPPRHAEGLPRFVQKLPIEKRGPVWAVTAEQHYLRVYTARGNDLILMRFSDALDELSAHAGMQIHHSHWVAQSGAEGIEVETKRLFVRLKNGAKLPVSRPNTTAARTMFENIKSAAAPTDEYAGIAHAAPLEPALVAA
jgi:hypothetical protein